MLSSSSRLYSDASLFSLDDFDQLFFYIQSNKTIRASLAAMTAIDQPVMALKQAINAGNSHAEVFNDPKCYLYLLFLIKTKEVTFRQGMSVFAFLLALMQFTDRQPLREEDMDVKQIREIEVHSLTLNGKLTPLAILFLQTIIVKLEKMGQVISYQELEKYILALSAVEQWLIKIPCTLSKKSRSHADILMSRLIPNFPIILDEYHPNEICYFYFPSVTLIHHIIQRTSPAPMRAIYCFGDLRPSTVREQHENHCLPVSLYGLDVITNPKSADQYRCGPFVMLFHDEFHKYGSSLLKKSERDFIFTNFIPTLEALCKTAQAFQDEAVVKLLESAIEQANDLNLSAIGDYDKDHKEVRLCTYLARAFGGNRDNTIYPKGKLDAEGKPIEYQAYGLPAQDRLYFLIYKHYMDLPDNADKKIWHAIISACKTGAGYRRTSIVSMIKFAAIFAVTQKPEVDLLQYYHLTNDDWRSLLTMIDLVKSGDDLWKLISKNENRSLLPALISTTLLAIMPPYFPLNGDVMAELRKMATDALQMNTNLKC